MANPNPEDLYQEPYQDYYQDGDFSFDGRQEPPNRAANQRSKRRSHRHLPSRFPPPASSIPTINAALGLDHDGNGIMSLNASNGQFPSFLENQSGNAAGMGGGMGMQQRQAPSPSMSQTQGLNNGNGVGNGGIGMGMGMPVMAGMQMDVNMVYQRLLDLSEVLRENRERTQGIVAGAEELAVCAVDIVLLFFRLDSCVGRSLLLFFRLCCYMILSSAFSVCAKFSRKPFYPCTLDAKLVLLMDSSYHSCNILFSPLTRCGNRHERLPAEQVHPFRKPITKFLVSLRPQSPILPSRLSIRANLVEETPACCLAKADPDTI